VEHDWNTIDSLSFFLYKQSQAVVISYIHNNEKVTGLHEGFEFDIAGLETFSRGCLTTDGSFQISVFLQEIRSA